MYQNLLRAFILLMLPCMLRAQSDSSQSNHHPLQELIVSAISVKASQPLVQLTMNRKQIQSRYYGADIPSLIQFTPSVNSYSDNGTGIGYSYFRLRGMDQTRINTTVNGIPINDPENQGVFFNNFADLASGAEQIQVIRGVGSSTNGTSSFGGSVAILTRNLGEKPEAQITLGSGSYNSQRATIELQSGMLANQFAFYGRFSHLSTDGYKYNSGAEINTYQLSAGKFGKNYLLKFNAFGGFAQNQLAYNGITQATMDFDRRYNTIKHGESDAFNQHFFQIQYNAQLDKQTTFSSSVYLVKGMAPRFQFYNYENWALPFSSYNMPNAIVNSDTFSFAKDMLSSYRLNQTFFGGFFNINRRYNWGDATFGFHANTFASDHFMEVNWGQLLPANIAPNHRVYFNTGYKQEWSAMYKWNFSINQNLTWYGDLQYRYAAFQYQGHDMDIRKEYGKVDDMSWVFFNPKSGLNYTINNQSRVFASLALNQREPTRFDYFQDDFATADHTYQNAIKPEQVMDYEVGYSYRNQDLYTQVNAFYMDFQNQIISTGQLNVFGYPMTTNVNQSYRAGIECELEMRVPNTHWYISHHSAFSRNKILNLDLLYRYEPKPDSMVSIHHSSTNALLSPESIIQQGIGYRIPKLIDVFGNMRFVSMQYLDNSSSSVTQLPAYELYDLKINFIIPEKWVHANMQLNLLINNLLDTKYCSSGNIQASSNNISGNGLIESVPLYLVNAGRNYMLSLTAKF